VSGGTSAGVANNECFVSGAQSVLVGSFRAELHTANALAGGYGVGAIVETDANQNLSWRIESNGGNAHFGGDLAVGGDVDAGTGATFEVTGTDGSFHAEGLATLDAGIEVPTAADSVGGIVGPIAATNPLPAGATFSCVITNNKIDANSIVLWSFSYTYDFGGWPIQGHGQIAMSACTPSAGQVILDVINVTAGALASVQITYRYMVVNPA
jgi:hypothetical protein